MKKTHFFGNDELFFDKEGIIIEASNFMDNDFSKNTICLIPIFKNNSKALDIILRWIYRDHRNEFDKALQMLATIPYSTISKVLFLANKFKLLKAEIGNDPKFVDIRFNKSTTKLTFIKDHKHDLTLTQQTEISVTAMIHTIFIATKFNEKDEFIKSTLNNLVTDLNIYHKLIGQNNDCFLASVNIIIGCLKLQHQQRFTNHYQNIISEFKNKPRLANNLVKSLIKSNKFNLVEDFLKTLENNIQNIVDKKIYSLYINFV